MTQATAKESDAELKTRYGPFRLIAFEFPSGSAHAALVKGDLSAVEHPLVRVQSACLTATALGAVGCDCADQMDEALRLVSDAGAGLVLYLDQEGMGHGLVEKVLHFREINRGADTYEAALRRGVDPDVRDYAETAIILRELIGDRSIRLLTNNPEKEARLQQVGVTIWDSLPIESEPTEANRGYLQAKKLKLHHRLTKV